MSKICAWCGKEYESASLKRKYCTELCARLAHNQRSADCKKRREEASPNPKETRECVICGKEFVVGRGCSICCSDECRTENSRRRSLENYYLNKAKNKKTRKCAVCGREFEVRGALKVCSPECADLREKVKRQEEWKKYASIVQKKRDANLNQEQMFDGKVLHRAEMTVDEYNRKHGTNYSYGQYVFYVESKGVK